MNTKIGIVVGSLRKNSFSKKIASAIMDMAPNEFDFNIVSLDDLPVYNQDFDDEDRAPESYGKFREEINSAQGIIFITPEYNRSVPGVLKNAVDIGSRPYGHNVWGGKPALVISNSPGNLAAFGANHHLRQSLVVLNVPVMQQPEVYLPNIGEAFDDNGNFKNGKTKEFLQSAIDAYVEWFRKNS